MNSLLMNFQTIYELRLFGKCYLDWNNTYFNGIGIFLYLYWTFKNFSVERCNLHEV